MKKVVYTMEQAQIIASFIGSLTISGSEACKAMYKAIEAIENPIETIDDKDGEEK